MIGSTPFRLLLGLTVFLIGGACWRLTAQEAPQKTFVGTDACKDCHEDQYASFKASSRKAHSSRNLVLLKDLEERERADCLRCHTTGFGQPGGFISQQETPHQADLGCESCHGPGSAHIATTDPNQIKGKLTMDDCRHCHTEEVVKAFGRKVLMVAGGH